MNQFVKITIVTALSVAFMAIVYVVGSKFMINTISDMTQEMVQQHQQRIEQRNAKLAEEQQRKENTARLQAAETARLQALASQKEAAWVKWYKDPDGCNSFKSDQHMVECINHKMRSKSEFEKLWAEGKIDRTTL